MVSTSTPVKMQSANLQEIRSVNYEHFRVISKNLITCHVELLFHQLSSFSVGHRPGSFKNGERCCMKLGLVVRVGVSYRGSACHLLRSFCSSAVLETSKLNMTVSFNFPLANCTLEQLKLNVIKKSII